MNLRRIVGIDDSVRLGKILASNKVLLGLLCCVRGRCAANGANRQSSVHLHYKSDINANRSVKNGSHDRSAHTGCRFAI